MTEAPNTVMLFAAGFGTRMGALTRNRPKPLVEVAGRPLIDHTLDLIEQAGLAKTVANLHYLPDQLARHLRPRGVALSIETPEILDTGGGLKAALPLTGPGPIFTSTSDAIWSGPNPFRFAAEHWNPDSMDALLVCVPLGQTLGRQGGGDFSLVAENRLSRGGDMVFGGVQILKTEPVAAFPDRVFSLNAIWDEMANARRLCGAAYPGRWCDIGRPEGIGLAETLLSEPHV